MRESYFCWDKGEGLVVDSISFLLSRCPSWFTSPVALGSNTREIVAPLHSTDHVGCMLVVCLWQFCVSFFVMFVACLLYACCIFIVSKMVAQYIIWAN